MSAPAPFPIYNLCVGAGVALGTLVYHRRLRSYLPDESFRARAMGALVVALPSAIVGAVLFDRAVGVSTGPWLPVRGLAFYGGLLAALGVGAIVSVALRLPLFRVLDAAAPGLALGHAVGRIACALGGCCYGRAVDHGAWHRLGFERIPTQGLESIGLALLAWGLVRLRPRRPGDVIVAYVTGYALLRFALEPLRGDARGAIPGVPHMLSPAQWIALASAMGAALVARMRRRDAMSEVAS